MALTNAKQTITGALVTKTYANSDCENVFDALIAYRYHSFGLCHQTGTHASNNHYEITTILLDPEIPKNKDNPAAPNTIETRFFDDDQCTQENTNSFVTGAIDQTTSYLCEESTLFPGTFEAQFYTLDSTYWTTNVPDFTAIDYNGSQKYYSNLAACQAKDQSQLQSLSVFPTEVCYGDIVTNSSSIRKCSNTGQCNKWDWAGTKCNAGVGTQSTLLYNPSTCSNAEDVKSGYATTTCIGPDKPAPPAPVPSSDGEHSGGTGAELVVLFIMLALIAVGAGIYYNNKFGKGGSSQGHFFTRHGGWQQEDEIEYSAVDADFNPLNDE